VETRLADRPEAVAFIAEERRISYGEFADLCRRTETWLRAQGIGGGDKVAVWLVNRVEWLALFFALARIGATLVSVNTRYRSEEVTYILDKSGACMLVLQPGFRSIDFAGILAGMDAALLPALRTLAVLDAD